MLFSDASAVTGKLKSWILSIQPAVRNATLRKLMATINLFAQQVVRNWQKYVQSLQSVELTVRQISMQSMIMYCLFSLTAAGMSNLLGYRIHIGRHCRDSPTDAAGIERICLISTRNLLEQNHALRKNCSTGDLDASDRILKHAKKRKFGVVNFFYRLCNFDDVL